MGAALEDRLLAIMDTKDHWAWPCFTRPGLSKRQLLVHFRHEYQTYVRDFPVLLARLLGQGPPHGVRAAIAENIFEEQTGKLSLGIAHPELFLDMMAGLGFPREALESPSPALEAEAIAYRRLLDARAAEAPWQVSAAVLAIFVEGSKNERWALSGLVEEKPIDEAIREHPLVRAFGCPPERMRLVRAHRMVEGGHRRDAWAMVLEHVPADSALADEVVAKVAEVRDAWLAYRDGVARAMGLARRDAA